MHLISYLHRLGILLCKEDIQFIYCIQYLCSFILHRLPIVTKKKKWKKNTDIGNMDKDW